MHTVAILKANVTGKILPVLMVEDASGEVRPLRELLDLSVNLLTSGSEFEDVRALNKTIGRYADLYSAVCHWAPIAADDLIALTYLYADCRLHGAADLRDEDPLGLGWPPVRWATFQNDLRHILNYSEWCTTQYGYLPLLPTARLAVTPGSRATLIRMPQQKQRDFMAHLADRRAFWQSLLPRQQRPKLRVRHQRRQKRGADEALSEAFVRDLIDQEKHPVYRALWIMAAWGGPRISEQLNTWVCDVLPGSERPRFFKGDPDRTTPLILTADPWESTWCGSYSNRETTRTQFLYERYRLMPRPDLGPPASSDQATRVGKVGFKGVAWQNAERKLSQIYWLDNEMAAEYFRLARQMIEFHQTHGVSARHPWLWVVTDPRKPGAIGNPLKISSVESAYVRACRRLGVNAHENGRSIHGLRHFFEAFSENDLDMGKATIQVLMHHRSEKSQSDYGWRDNVKIRDALESGYDKLKQKDA